MIILKWYYKRRKDRLDKKEQSQLAKEATPTEGVVEEADAKADTAI